MTTRPLHRRAVALAPLLACALVAPLTAPAAAAQTVPVRTICFPNEGPPYYGSPPSSAWITSYYSDTFGAPRSGGRGHEGADIMSARSKKMRRLVAPVTGTVSEIVYGGPGRYDPPGNGTPRNEPGAGNRVVIRDAEGWEYVFIHMNNDTPGVAEDNNAAAQYVFAPGLDVGVGVTAGGFIGYLGDSGNAESTAPHNHFEIRRPGSGHWSLREAINPTPSLRAAENRPERCPAQRFQPFRDITEFVDRQYRDFLGRAPEVTGRNAWTDQINTDQETPVSYITQLMSSDEFAVRIAPIARLYKAFFLRVPDVNGLRGWVDLMSRGTTLPQVAEAFALSPEFQDRYGALSNEAYVDLVYQNVLGRAPDPAGRAGWIDALESGRNDRGLVMLGFSESTEFVGATRKWVEVVLIYLGMLGRAPDPVGLEGWVGVGDLTNLINGVLYSPEYAGRINRLRTG